MKHFTIPWRNDTPSGVTGCGVGAQGIAFADRVTVAAAWARVPGAERCDGCQRAVKGGRV